MTAAAEPIDRAQAERDEARRQPMSVLTFLACLVGRYVVLARWWRARVAEAERRVADPP